MPSIPLALRVGSLVGALVATVAACDKEEAAPPTDAAAPSATQDLLQAAEEEQARAARPQKKGEATSAGERVKIAAGKLTAGSTPGDRGRDPSFEPALLEVELAAFEIDKLPHPNDPARAPRTGLSRDQAEAACKEVDGRLCTELEWEMACKGPDGQRYAGGDVWDPTCAKSPETCASGYGVLAMGGALREWTASNVQPIKEFLKREGAAVRGALADAADVDHRCAHRATVDPASSAPDLGFRCCYGAANEPVIRSPTWLATIRNADLPADRLSKLFASDRRLAAVASDIKYFRKESAVDTVMRRAKARKGGADGGTLPPNVEATTSPVIWNPAPGEELLLVTGQSGKRSFIVAFHVLPNERYRVGAAMILEDELGPIVLFYNPYVRRKLEWAMCWGCPAEAGFITYRDDNRVVITQE